MKPHALATALALFQSGTLTLSQAAARAGCTEQELASALRRRGVDVDTDASLAGESPTRAARAD